MGRQQEDGWELTDSGKEIDRKIKNHLETTTKLQGVQEEIDITKNSVRDINNRNEEDSRKWHWNNRDKKDQSETDRGFPLFEGQSFEIEWQWKMNRNNM